MAKSVSRDVVEKVAGNGGPLARAKAGFRGPGRYLVRRDDSYFFQVRIPKGLVGRTRIPPLRIKLGHRPRRAAQAMAESMARAAKDTFETLKMLTRCDEFRAEGTLGFDPGSSPEEFHANMLSFLERALAIVSRPPKFTARDHRNAAMWKDLFELQQEIDKGEAGSTLAQTYATTLRQEIMRRWRVSQGYLDEHEDPAEAPAARPASAIDTPLLPSWEPQAALPRRRTVPPKAEEPLSEEPAPWPQAPAAVAATATTPTAPEALLFSKAAEQYLQWRQGAGADKGAISTARLRLDVYLALMGDKPIVDFCPRDLQLYVNELQHLPLEFGREGEHSTEIRELGPRAAVERNKTSHCWQPMARKTMEDGYVQVAKAVVNDAVRNIGCKHPLAGARIAWPANARPSVSREALDDATMGKVFELGVASGFLDDAVLPALAFTSSRRIGLLAFLRGSDFERRHGIIVCRVDGIGYDQAKKTWYRVPFKTDGSLAYFALHDLWSKVGFVEWAMTQGDTFLFRQLHATRDPADALSKRTNRLLVRAGAKGGNVEVGHSLRHGAKDLMRTQLDPETIRKQMGHALSGDDAHAGYGAHSVLSATECQRLAHLSLPPTINWEVFEGLDFEAMASKPRQRGRSGLPEKRGAAEV